MQLTALGPTIIDRLLVLETAAAHAHAVAAVAEHLAWRERQEADRLQAVLSEVKVFLALLPDDCRLELKAPRPSAEAPADRLGVRLRLPVSRPDREFLSCLAPPSRVPASSAMRPANRETTPTIISAPGPAPG
jgi:hypothetical protein